MKTISKLFVSVLLVLTSVHTYAQRQQQDSLTRYLNSLAASDDEGQRARLESELYKLLLSDNERDWLTASRFFEQIKKTRIVDSLAVAIRQRFPKGQFARNEMINSVYNEKDPYKKEKLFNDLIAAFPPPETPDISYDYARNAVSTAFAEIDKVDKAIYYANSIQTPAWKGEGWAGTAYVLLRKGYLNVALELFKKARINSLLFKTTLRDQPGAGFATIGLPGYTTKIAEIYLKKDQPRLAMGYLKEVVDNSPAVRGDVSETYAGILMKFGKDKEAFEVLTKALEAGQANEAMKKSIKELYQKINGSDAGYADFITSYNDKLSAQLKADLAKKLLNQAAPDFSMKDIDGNTVSLSDYKGKILILDFWATWCGPCIRSFPAMKASIERLKNNPDVKFLFIHTMERENDATEKAKEFIGKNNYPFHVAMDLKNDAGVNKAAQDYNVTGIPTKVVIDGKGNIRYRFFGFSGGDDAAVEEIAAIVDLISEK